MSTLSHRTIYTLNVFSILIHPGLNGAGPDQRQTHRNQAFPDFIRA